MAPPTREENLRYIANFTFNIAGTTGAIAFAKYFVSELGDELFSANDDAIKKLARHLYKSYVLSHFTRHRAFMIAESLTDAQIAKYLEEEVALDVKYKLNYDTISTDLSNAAIDSHIKNVSLTKYKSILTKFETAKSKMEAPVKTTTKKVTAGKKVPAKKKSASPVKKPAKKVTTKKSPAKKTASSYTIPELKEMAKSKGLSGYSKLNKADLCKMLKIK